MKWTIKFEWIVLVALLSVFGVLGVWFTHHAAAKREALVVRAWRCSEQTDAVLPLDVRPLEAAARAAAQPAQSGGLDDGLLSSEVRVAAVGGAFPIPFDAQVCPFSGMPQPSAGQLDRDGDGLPDEWESEYGLDKARRADAASDLDEDGFTNLEEFRAGSHPADAADHPPYITKMRFVGKKEVPFPLVFMGAVKLPDGRTVFQLNRVASRKTRFQTIGGEIEGIELKRLIPREKRRKARLVVERDGVEVELPRGEKVPDPKSRGELINILDRSSEIATMGALLSLRNDVYTVLEVHPDKVTVRYHKTGEVFEVVGFAEGEREAVFGGLEE